MTYKSNLRAHFLCFRAIIYFISSEIVKKNLYEVGLKN